MASKEKKILKDGLWSANPITFQVLGICSALAVTVQVRTAAVMCLALTFTVVLSNTVISLLRHRIPGKIRLIIQLSIIATLVIVADQLLKAFLFSVSKQLSVYVGLIITNCIVLGRAEAYAMQNPPWRSAVDGLANSLGYSVVLLSIATLREILGSGSFLGHPVVPEALYRLGYLNCGLMVLAPGAFILLGLFVWIQRSISGHAEEN
jgi:Na+-transporting NADH:ubiquinone oxidoreductase subunit D